MFRWLIGVLAFAAFTVGAAVIRHEIVLNTLSAKMDLIIDHFGLEIKK